MVQFAGLTFSEQLDRSFVHQGDAAAGARQLWINAQLRFGIPKFQPVAV